MDDRGPARHRTREADRTGGRVGLQLPKWLIKLSGELYLHNYLFWIVYRPHHYAMSGPDVRKVIENVQPGDILLRRYDGYVNTLFTPGFWGHAALCVNRTEVIHAVGVGVVREDLITFCRTDSVAVLRLKDATADMTERAIACAEAHEKARTAYDYRFRDKNHAVYCTELVNVCYNGLFNSDFEVAAGNCILAPDGIRRSTRVSAVVECTYDPKERSVKRREIMPETCEDTLAKRVAELGSLPTHMKLPRKRRP
jgi:hypothetical protein